MPHASKNKIALAPNKRNQVWLFVACTIIFFAVLTISQLFGRLDRRQQLPTRNVTLDGRVLQAQIADDEQERTKGLSDRNSLADGQAFILSFQKKTPGGIWMKDMRFPIDVLWVTADGKVVGLVRNISPSSYPNVYYSSIPVNSVVELPAGYIDTHKIRIGSMLRFQ